MSWDSFKEYLRATVYSGHIDALNGEKLRSMMAPFLAEASSSSGMSAKSLASEILAATKFHPIFTKQLERSFSAKVGSFFSAVVMLYLAFCFVGSLDKGTGMVGSDGRQSSKMIEKSTHSFKDVAGVDEAKAELQEVVDYLKNPQRFSKLGGKLPKGLLLEGEPGTGKTLLARAIAGEAGVPFFYACGSEFDEVFVGLGAKRVRQLFQDAKKHAPCIIFLDEIDAVGGGQRQVKDQAAMRMTLNQLLTEMDGFESNNGIIVIGATNFSESLDKALTRPGRFDRHVQVPLPHQKGREEILQLYGKKITLDKKADLKSLAKRSAGASGADLFNIMNTGALRAAQRGANAVTQKDLDEAFDHVLMGPQRKSLVLTPEDKYHTAIHESGHAVASLFTKGADTIHKATIMPRGPALGMVQYLGQEEHRNFTREQFMAQLDTAMAGRAAEDIKWGIDKLTGGCSNDIQQATQIARMMVCKLGMCEEEFGLMVPNEHSSPETKNKIDKAVSKLLTESYDRTKALLTAKWKQVEHLAKTLVDHETLDVNEVNEVVFQGKIHGKRVRI
eukprot:TRINITY_DN848_c0_g1_i1.p1 TRINITY_DN848_c0_g1~~TRINITY_DN848_c0_g1_i1.p1  ORF type:complete len:621 (+),score=213.23 TRINITY_DN848_c0_g1_i1:188-1864(+)